MTERKIDTDPQGRRRTGEGESKGGKTSLGASPAKRIPKTAAVTITGKDFTFSYAAALRRARDEISLKDLGIDDSRIRKTINGG